jgi:hypothetical protein
VESLGQLQERRAYECRLTPDRTLESLDEAEEFLRDRGLLTRTADSALPSLYEACHEEPYKAGAPGFATWPATKWPWFGELAERGYLCLAVHRGKNLLVTDDVARVMDPIIRAEIERMRRADPQWDRFLDHLAGAGASNIEDLQVELDLRPKELKLLRSPLERCGVVVARSLQVTAGGRHTHTSELVRWDQLCMQTDADPAMDISLKDAVRTLVTIGVRAAVVAPERELKRWFSWQWYWDDELVEDLVRDGRLRRVDGHVTAAQ